MKKIETRFGQVEYDPANLLHFPTGLIGFPTLHDFIVMPNKKKGSKTRINSKEKEASNGMEILKDIKQRNKSIPVVMLSSQEKYTIAAQTIGLGAIHYVIKGQDAFEEIQKIIEANI